MLTELEVEHEHDPLTAMAQFRAIAEGDFWFYTKYVSAFGGYVISDPGHDHYGKLWIDEPWLFDRLREFQAVLEERTDNTLCYMFRESFKTTCFVRNGSLWLLCRNPNERICVMTHKMDQVGENMGEALLTEVQTNATLRAHWPQFRTLLEASSSRITVTREPGPQEPSLSLYPIMGSAVAGHFTWLWVDDPIVDRIIDSPEMIAKVENQISRMAPLATDDAPIVYVGTPWGEVDPIYKKHVRNGFDRTLYYPAFDSVGRPQLRSKKFFERKRKHMTTYDFSCQYGLKPVARGDRYFLDGWKRTYIENRVEVGASSFVHVIMDMGGGKEDADFTVLRVIARCPDRTTRNLDLWRERIGLSDTLDLLFGLPEQYHDETTHAWKPRAGIMPFWQRNCLDLILWVEEFGASAWYEAIRQEMKNRKLDFKVRKLPSVNRPKPSRIRLLQPDYRNGLILYPFGGFGHGSRDDERDTMVQFYADEYELWTLDEKNVLHDDMLDTEAWYVQPEVVAQMPFPEGMVESGPDWGWPYNRMQDGGADVPYGRASWRVA